MVKYSSLTPSPVRLAVSMGDPAGVGLELLFRLAASEGFPDGVEVALYGPRDILRTARDRWVGDERPPIRMFGPITSGTQAHPEPTSTDIARHTLSSIQFATTGVLTGQDDALVTLPITKGVFATQNLPHLGHTHYLTELCEASKPGAPPWRALMSMVAPELRLSVLTDHIPLRDVPVQVTAADVAWAIDTIHQASPLFGLERPRIAVCGVNPHAGESGAIGDEDQALVPAIAEARARGVEVSGPHAGDSIFWQARQGRYDWVLALFHDQGLAPIKTLAFDRTVNVTLGLPIIRTSPGHGVAYDLAGTGTADVTNLRETIRLTVEMVRRKKDLAWAARRPGRKGRKGR